MMDLELMKFSIKLEELRVQAGLSPNELAEKAGINPATMRGYLAGTRKNPSGLNILMLAKALDVSSDVFMDCLDSLGADSVKKTRKKK